MYVSKNMRSDNTVTIPLKMTSIEDVNEYKTLLCFIPPFQYTQTIK